MKFNWGTGVALFYLSFMAAMIYMVVRSTQFDRDLVEDNYYQKDLEYQSHLDKVANAAKLPTDLELFQNKTESYLRFSFPANLENINGEILLYRPSNKSQDVHMDIEVNADHNFIVSTQDLAKGLWKAKINWSGDHIDFYKEININL